MKAAPNKVKAALLATTLALSGGATAKAEGMDYQTVADLLHLVMDSDRAVYTKMVVGRLAGKGKVIKASEHFGKVVLRVD